MRINLTVIGIALASSLALSACSSGQLATVPGASQSATGAAGHHARPHVVAERRHRHAPYGNYLGTCPISGSSPYLGNYCYYIASGSSFSQGWCESYENNCGDIKTTHWYWAFSHVYKANGMPVSKAKMSSSWSQNPSNPSNNTVTVSASVAPTPGSVNYYTTIRACTHYGFYGPDGYCDPSATGDYEIGIVIQSPYGSGG